MVDYQIAFSKETMFLFGTESKSTSLKKHHQLEKEYFRISLYTKRWDCN
jgi:tRNA(Leu) C34 or U34 (ribose-2'-O)-methylase TrmL